MSDARTFRRLCIQMSAAGYGEMGYFMSLSVEELMEIVDEVGQIARERRKMLKKRS